MINYLKLTCVSRMSGRHRLFASELLRPQRPRAGQFHTPFIGYN